MNSKQFFICKIMAAQLLFVNFAQAKVDAVIGPVPLKDNVNLSQLRPFANQSEIIISRDQYVISYNKERNSLNWVAWKLEANQIGKVQRSNDFQQDPDLEKYLAQQAPTFKATIPEDFKGTCFDRGHQAPSADRTDSSIDNEATFLMSNMLPQTAHLNRFIWEHLERHTREIVQNENKKVYLMAGPIYDQDYGMIGLKKNIPVPSKNFKILVILDAQQTLADVNEDTTIISIIMPNSLADGSSPTNTTQLCKESVAVESTMSPDTDWEQYKTTLQEIEKESGLKFTTVSAK